VSEARAAGLDPALALALVERESAFRNVFGNDPVEPPQARGGAVTRAAYRRYRELRDRGHGAQGVGLTQLTWPSFQDDADRIGGCWKPRAQLRVGFRVLASLIDARGTREGIAAYNGAGPRAERYATEVLAFAERWERVLGPRATGDRAAGRQVASPSPEQS
jgi:hypothetical protein